MRIEYQYLNCKVSYLFIFCNSIYLRKNKLSLSLSVSRDLNPRQNTE